MLKNEPYNAIIIGSGIGGLSAAALLARIKRYRVLVLERHFQLGGFTHTFRRRGGYHWDVGLHYVGEMHPGEPLRLAMDFITGDRVKWVQMQDPFEVFQFPGLKFEVPSDPNVYLQKLVDLFPNEQQQLRNYFRDVELSALSLQDRSLPFLGRLGYHKHVARHYFDIAMQPLKAYLDSCFQDNRLKGLLASQWGDYGLPPKRASFGIHSLTVQHYLRGGYYPVGSSSTLSDAVKTVVKDAGGELKVNNTVKKILVENGRAVGVEVESQKGLEAFFAPEIYSDVGAEATYGKLLPAETLNPDEFKELCTAHTYSAVVLYMGLKSRCEHLGIYGQNFWIFDDFDHDAIWERRNRLAVGEASSCYLSFPGIKDPLSQKPTAEIMASLDYSVFQQWKDTVWRKRGSEYEMLKNRIIKTLLEFVDSRIPGFLAEVDYVELSTPLSSEYFSSHREGNLYGFPGIPRRYSLKSLSPKTTIEGLTVVGTDAYSHGITGAMMGGILGVSAQHGVGILQQVFKKK
jgi:phytoene dehydrogenase-like protein